MRRLQSRSSPALEKARGFFRSIKESISPEMPAFAVAGAPGFAMPPNVMQFHVGEAPPKGTPSRRIMEWGNIGIVPPGGKPGKHSISFEAAQEEVGRMLKGEGNNHQYIAYEAAKLCAVYPEVAKYTLHLMVGAGAEDYVFLPNESLDDIYARPPKRRFSSMHEFSAAVEPGEVPSLLQGIFRTASRIWKKVKKSFDGDSINRPYFAHFYDPRRRAGEQGLDILDGDLKFVSALDRMQRYWDYASILYQQGQMPRAFYALGHLIHLVQDLHVPAHTHNDIHGPTVFLGKPDSLEQWCVRSDHPHITRPGKNDNIKIWDSGPLSPPRPDRSWSRDNIREKLSEFVDSFVRRTQRFRSVDAMGTDKDQRRTGKLSDGECYSQANVLIPQAIRDSARLIVNFIDYNERL